MKNRPRLSLITVSYNSVEDLPKLFASYEEARKQLPVRCEYFLVDNASSDSSVEVVQKNFPAVRVLALRENSGFAGGCNAGLKEAKGNFLCLINPDCELNSRALMGMMKFLAKHPKTGMVGCQLLHEDGLPQQSAYQDIGIFSYLKTHSLLSPLLEKLGKITGKINRKKKSRKVGWLMGSCLMVKREVYESIGGLDESFFMYSEDADWCRQARNAGYEVRYLPYFSIIHRQGSGAKKNPERAFLLLYRSLFLYGRKNFGKVEMLNFRILIAKDMIFRLPIYLLTRRRARFESSKRVLRAAITGNFDEMGMVTE